MLLHPGLHVFYASRIEDLHAQLATDLAVHRHTQGPWSPVPVVVPNPNVKDHLRATLARTFGAVANLHFQYLEGFWRQHLAGPLLGRAGLEGLVLGLLQDPASREDPDLAPLWQYLEGEPRDLKAVQLTQRCARLLERLLLHRPDWLLAWEGKGVPRDLPQNPTARWQAALWRRLRRLMDLEGRAPVPQALLDSDLSGFPETVFLFGMGHMAPLYHRVLARLGERACVRLYLLAPCRELWEGERPPRLGLPEGEDPYDLETGSRVLQRWARPGREQLRLLNEGVQGEFHGRLGVPAVQGNLTALQARVLDPEAGTVLFGPPDDTLLALPCPTPAREAEVVASFIWTWIQAVPGRRFSEVTILVPPAEEDAYLAHLEEAFRGTHDLPWTRALGGSRALKAQVEATGLLLGLASGELSRADLLRAAVHPVLAAHWPDTDPAAWADLCDRAGIISRLDAQETTGTYRAGGVWTWEQGLQRLALGAFMTPEPGGPVGGQEAPALVRALGALARDLRALSRARLPLEAWSERLRTFLQAWLVADPATAEEAETQALARITRAVEGLRELHAPSLPPVRLDFPAVRGLVLAALEGLLGDQALSPGRGIQVGCYTPLRAVPSGALILMGLGEGIFPASPRPDPLDLMAEGPRRAGDVSPLEQDRHLFLESLMSCRESLVLTWPSRDPLTGDDLEPSPLVRGLAESLGDEAWRQVLRPEQPLHRFDAAAFPHLGPVPPGILPCHHGTARKEAELRWLGQRLQAQVGGQDLPLRLDGWGRELLAPRLPAFSLQLPPAPDLPARLTVTLSQLKTWLECPVQGGEAFRLGLGREAEEDPAEVSEDPLDPPFLEGWSLRRAAFWDHAAALDGTPGEALARRARILEADARLPLAPLSQTALARYTAQVEGWLAQVPLPEPPRIHRFGQGAVAEGLPVVDHGALDLEVATPRGPVQVRLVGAADPLLPDGSLLLLTDRDPVGAKGPEVASTDQRQALRAWIAHLVLCAKGEALPRRALLVGPASRAQLPFEPLAPEGARDRLATWLGTLLTEPADRLLPFEALFADGAAKDLAGWVERALEERQHVACLRGPLPARALRTLEAEADLAPGRARLAPFPALDLPWSEA